MIAILLALLQAGQESDHLHLEAVPIPAPVCKHWSFVGMDRSGTVFAQVSAEPTVFVIEGVRQGHPVAAAIPLEDGRSLNSIERLNTGRLIATLTVGGVLSQDEQGRLALRKDLGLLRGGSLHRADGDDWWLVEHNTINHLDGDLQQKVVVPADVIRDGIMFAVAGTLGELLIRDGSGSVHVISADASALTTFRLAPRFASSLGLAQIKGVSLVLAQDGLLGLGRTTWERSIASMLDRPIWRPLVDGEDTLYLAEARGGRIFRCTLTLPVEGPPEPTVQVDTKPVPLSGVLAFIAQSK